MEDDIRLYDVTLRDGNHALRHQLTSDFVTKYCSIADGSDVWAVEVGHGNGLGASSFLVGKSAEDDMALLEAARTSLQRIKLAVHAIPGIATIKKNIKPAISIGVDIFRIATHVTEATVSEKHIEFVVNQGKAAHGVLMMSHMCSTAELVQQARLMLQYGASAVVLMDSAGNYIQPNVEERVRAVREEVGLEIGFHAHNNLGVGVSNALAAIKSGARIVDGSSMGLGAGSGNAQLENVVANVDRQHISRLELKHFLEMSRLVEDNFENWLPRTNSSSVQSGLAGVFSGYSPQVNQLADEFGIDTGDLWVEIGRRKLVAGQETLIREIAQDLRNL